MAQKYSLNEINEKLLQQNKIFLDSNYCSVLEKHNIQCLKCKYVWQSTLASLFSNNIKCPSCSKKKRYTTEIVNEICSKKHLLFLNPPYKNNFTKYQFKCSNCGYIWTCSLRNILLCSCPGCTNKKVTVEKVKELCLKRNIIFLSKEVTRKDDKHKFKCKKCKKSWEAALRNVIGPVASGCPNCQQGRGEKVVREIFEDITQQKFLKIRPDWLINPETGKRLELDGYCSSLNIAFEYQGEQHYREVKGFQVDKQKLKEQKKRDRLKKELCQKKGIKLIEVPQIGLLFYYKDLRAYILAELDK